MKSFLVSLVLIALMIGGVTANCIYINKVGNRIQESTKQLPIPSEADCLRKVSELENQWKKDAQWIQIGRAHV